LAPNQSQKIVLEDYRKLSGVSI